jgi:hypothetical protein
VVAPSCQCPWVRSAWDDSSWRGNVRGRVLGFGSSSWKIPNLRCNLKTGIDLHAREADSNSYPCQLRTGDAFVLDSGEVSLGISFCYCRRWKKTRASWVAMMGCAHGQVGCACRENRSGKAGRTGREKGEKRESEWVSWVSAHKGLRFEKPFLFSRFNHRFESISNSNEF